MVSLASKSPLDALKCSNAQKRLLQVGSASEPNSGVLKVSKPLFSATSLAIYRDTSCGVTVSLNSSVCGAAA
jgi:hypothetical protein